MIQYGFSLINDVSLLISEYEARLLKIKNNAEKWLSQPVYNIHHLVVILTVITLLIMLGFQQISVYFVLPKIS